MTEHTLEHESHDKHYWALRLQENLGRVKSLRHAAHEDAHKTQARECVRTWQARRLAASYADLLASERYAPAARFFLDELYGNKDGGERDAEVERIMPTLLKVLPASGLCVLAAALELDALSEALDHGMAERLHAAGALTALTPEAYAAAYRAGNNPGERARQIALTREVGTTLDHLTQKPLLGLSLRMMKGPAQLAGLADLYRFLEQGYTSFRHMAGADEFLAIICSRESALMDTLFCGGCDGL
ncbi:FFLEELY motif protein [Craterilacuibacter sp.]|uniref:FFLEELY motif protein n=1 Tax=Craterilacuibacter sp. TaxID=2870909 RepID=UPI003F3395D1